MKLLRYADLEVMGLGVRSTIWRAIREDQFPAPLRLSEHRVAWPEDQVLAWIEARGTEKCAKVPLPKPNKQARA